MRASPSSSSSGWHETSGCAIVNFISAKRPRSRRSRMCCLRRVVGLGRRRADDVEPELLGCACELGCRHERILPVKAIRIHEDGGPEVLRYEDVPDPEPADGQVLVRLAAASLNHLDVWVRMGLPSVPKPRILGADGAGVVEALGAGVDGFAVGDRVVLNPGLEHGHTISVLGEHSRRHALRADRGRRGAGVRARRRADVRAGSGVPARLRDRVPDARHQGGRAAGRVGADLGHRRRRRDRGLRDLPRARRAHDRHLRQRREARAGARLGRRRRREPPHRRCRRRP